MRIEIWSDVACPWCFIGKRRVERAVASFHHPVELRYRAFLLDPGAPDVPVETMAAHLGRKYGGGLAGGQQMIDRVEAVAAEEGLLLRLGEAQRVSTVDAHRLLHLALAEAGPDTQVRLEEELFSAYFLRCENLADHATLRAAAAAVGIDGIGVDRLLAGDDLRDEVYADIDAAHDLGANGVPFHVVDGRFGVAGAQPAHVFTAALERAWSASHPSMDLVGAEEHGAACGPDGCRP